MLRRKRASAAADQVRQILQSDTGNPAKNLTMDEIIFFVCSPAMKFQTLIDLWHLGNQLFAFPLLNLLIPVLSVEWIVLA